MSAHQRHRFASALTRCLLASGLTAASGCAVDSPDASTSANPQDRIHRDVQRLAEVDVLQVGALASARTEWLPSNGTWTSSHVELGLDEQAARIRSLADAAEHAVVGIDEADIGPFGETNPLCYRLEPDKYCLTIDALATNLARLNQLEIVTVDDIVRSAPASTGFCYSSWETVGVDDCVRGIKLGAIADATREFPSSRAPDQAPE
jgi:hypothetical protein